MEIIKWLYLNIRSSAEPADWKFFDTWVVRESEDAEGRPHNTFLIPWKPDEFTHVELVDYKDPHIADTVVIRWDKTEVFRGQVLPRPSDRGFQDPNKLDRATQINIEYGNIDGRKGRFQMPPAPADHLPLDSECMEHIIEVEVHGRRERESRGVDGVAGRRAGTRSTIRVEMESFLIGTGVWKVRCHAAEWLERNGYEASPVVSAQYTCNKPLFDSSGTKIEYPSSQGLDQYSQSSCALSPNTNPIPSQRFSTVRTGNRLITLESASSHLVASPTSLPRRLSENHILPLSVRKETTSHTATVESLVQSCISLSRSLDASLIAASLIARGTGLEPSVTNAVNNLRTAMLGSSPIGYSAARGSSAARAAIFDQHSLTWALCLAAQHWRTHQETTMHDISAFGTQVPSILEVPLEFGVPSWAHPEGFATQDAEAISDADGSDPENSDIDPPGFFQPPPTLGSTPSPIRPRSSSTIRGRSMTSDGTLEHDIMFGAPRARSVTSVADQSMQASTPSTPSTEWDSDECPTDSLHAAGTRSPDGLIPRNLGESRTSSSSYTPPTDGLSANLSQPFTSPPPSLLPLPSSLTYSASVSSSSRSSSSKNVSPVDSGALTATAFSVYLAASNNNQLLNLHNEAAAPSVMASRPAKYMRKQNTAAASPSATSNKDTTPGIASPGAIDTQAVSSLNHIPGFSDAATDSERKEMESEPDELALIQLEELRLEEASKENQLKRIEGEINFHRRRQEELDAEQKVARKAFIHAQIKRIHFKVEHFGSKMTADEELKLIETQASLRDVILMMEKEDLATRKVELMERRAGKRPSSGFDEEGNRRVRARHEYAREVGDSMS